MNPGLFSVVLSSPWIWCFYSETTPYEKDLYGALYISKIQSLSSSISTGDTFKKLLHAWFNLLLELWNRQLIKKKTKNNLVWFDLSENLLEMNQIYISSLKWT